MWWYVDVCWLYCYKCSSVCLWFIVLLRDRERFPLYFTIMWHFHDVTWSSWCIWASCVIFIVDFICVCVRGSKLDTVEVLCFRDRTLQGSRSIQHSVILQVRLPELSNDSGKLLSCTPCILACRGISCVFVCTCICTCSSDCVCTCVNLVL